MTVTSGKVTAPVTVKEVADLIGEDDYRVSTVCRSAKVNLYARYKPIYHADNTTPTTDTLRRNNGWGCALMVPSLAGLVSWCTQGLAWLSRDSLSSCPTFLGDFRGYNHQATLFYHSLIPLSERTREISFYPSHDTSSANVHEVSVHYNVTDTSVMSLSVMYGSVAGRTLGGSSTANWTARLLVMDADGSVATYYDEPIPTNVNTITWYIDNFSAWVEGHTYYMIPVIRTDMYYVPCLPKAGYTMYQRVTKVLKTLDSVIGYDTAVYRVGSAGSMPTSTISGSYQIAYEGEGHTSAASRVSLDRDSFGLVAVFRLGTSMDTMQMVIVQPADFTLTLRKSDGTEYAMTGEGMRLYDYPSSKGSLTTFGATQSTEVEILNDDIWGVWFTSESFGSGSTWHDLGASQTFDMTLSASIKGDPLIDSLYLGTLYCSLT